MNIQSNVALDGYSTMRLGGIASFLSEVSSVSELLEAVAWAKEKNLPVIAVGEGSNIIWRDEGFKGLVIVNKILRYDLQPFDSDTANLTVGSGEPWDSVVERTVAAGYYTLAPLSLIPGTAGATPVQNVGAYGQEVSNCLMTLQAVEVATGQQVTQMASDCQFGYRTSRFKTVDHGKFIITSVTFSISKTPPTPPYYESLARYLRENNLTIKSPDDIRQAVIAIRNSKLPDPKVVANNGSFFANPIIAEDALMPLIELYEGLKYWHLQDGKVKLSAAWLVEQAGFKNVFDEETGMATWQDHSLVLVNRNAKSTADLLKFKEKIVKTVSDKFGVTLVQEPELLP